LGIEPRQPPPARTAPPVTRDSGLFSLDERSQRAAAKRDEGSGLRSLSGTSGTSRDSGLIDLSGRARGGDSGLVSLDEREGGRSRSSLPGASGSSSFSREGGSGLHALTAAPTAEPSFTSDPLATMGRAAAHHSFDLVGIGSSTGGLTALESVLSRLPHDFPVPICIAQHIGKGFDQDFVKTLQRATPLDVRLLHRPAPLTRGIVYVCPSGVHVVVNAGPTLALTEHPASSLYRPSVSVLFRSMADALGARSVAVLLTGMGDDGADGMLRVRERGGRTLVQNRETCLVFGMPRAAIQLGAAEEVLPLHDIAPALVRLVKAAPSGRW
jgi:chemotaxis response regulator CheB